MISIFFFFGGGGSLFSISIRVLTSVDLISHSLIFFEALSLELAVFSFAPFAKTYIDIMELKPLRKNTNNFKTESAAKLTFDFWTKYHPVRKIWVAYFMNNLKVLDYGRRSIPFSPLYVRIKLQCLNYVIHSIFVKNNLQIIG